MLEKAGAACYNRNGNAKARSICRHFRALFKHCDSDVIIETEMRKRQTFADIFALCSNLLAYVYEKRIVRWREAVNLFSCKNVKNYFGPERRKSI